MTSRLRIQRRHCCGSGSCCGQGSISGLGTSTCRRCGQQKVLSTRVAKLEGKGIDVDGCICQNMGKTWWERLWHRDQQSWEIERRRHLRTFPEHLDPKMPIGGYHGLACTQFKSSFSHESQSSFLWDGPGKKNILFSSGVWFSLLGILSRSHSPAILIWPIYLFTYQSKFTNLAQPRR